MPLSVVFTPEAQEQLVALYRYIDTATSSVIAERYTSAIVDFCEQLQEFPHRTLRRDDIRPGLHVTNFRGRVVVAYAVEEETLSIIGLYYGGRDFENLLLSDPDA